jgi:hypothetical protein
MRPRVWEEIGGSGTEGGEGTGRKMCGKGREGGKKLVHETVGHTFFSLAPYLEY